MGVKMNRRNLLKTVLGGLASLLLPIKFAQARPVALKGRIICYYSQGHYLKDGEVVWCAKDFHVISDCTHNDLASFFKKAMEDCYLAHTFRVVILEVPLNQVNRLKEEGKNLKTDCFDAQLSQQQSITFTKKNENCRRVEFQEAARFTHPGRMYEWPKQTNGAI
jgi:hypothetical protein